MLRAHSWHYSVEHGCKHKKPRETGHRLGVATSLSSPPPPEPFISTAARSQRSARSRQEVFGEVGKCVWWWLSGVEEFHHWNHLLSVLWFMARDNTGSSSSYGFFSEGIFGFSEDCPAAQHNVLVDSFYWSTVISMLSLTSFTKKGWALMWLNYRTGVLRKYWMTTIRNRFWRIGRVGLLDNLWQRSWTL